MKDSHEISQPLQLDVDVYEAAPARVDIVRGRADPHVRRAAARVAQQHRLVQLQRAGGERGTVLGDRRQISF